MGLSNSKRQQYEIFKDKIIASNKRNWLILELQEYLNTTRNSVIGVIRLFDLDVLATGEEKKKLVSKHLSEAAKKREASYTKKQRAAISEKIRCTLQKQHRDMTEEQKANFYTRTFGNISEENEKLRRKRISETQLNRTSEEKEIIYSKAKLTMLSKSEDELQRIRTKQANSLRKTINSMSSEKRKQWIENSSKGIKAFYQDMTEEEREAHKNRVLKNISATCMYKYGVPWYTLTPELISSGRMHSKVNEEYEKRLISCGIDAQSEFRIKNRLFDFKYKNYLIEIDPWSTHNIDWSPFGSKHLGIAEDYHREKSLLAKDNGYICVHIFDWMDFDKIAKSIKDETLYTIDRGNCTRYFWDFKKNELVDNQKSQDVVCVVDDGFDVIV